MAMFSRDIQDKTLALIITVLCIGAYFALVYTGRDNEFLKNISLLFAGVLAGLLRGEQQHQMEFQSNPKTGESTLKTGQPVIVEEVKKEG